MTLAKMFYYFHGDLNVVLTVLDSLTISVAALYFTLTLGMVFALNVPLGLLFVVCSPRYQGHTRLVSGSILWLALLILLGARIWWAALSLVLAYVLLNVLQKAVWSKISNGIDLRAWARQNTLNEDMELRGVAERVLDNPRASKGEQVGMIRTINQRVGGINSHPVTHVLAFVATYVILVGNVWLTLPPALSATYIVRVGEASFPAYVLAREESTVLVVPLESREPRRYSSTDVILETCASGANVITAIWPQGVEWPNISSCEIEG